eukprot:Clim_evm55s149 gene=Clim_evmTU55s149
MLGLRAFSSRGCPASRRLWTRSFSSGGETLPEIAAANEALRNGKPGLAWQEYTRAMQILQNLPDEMPVKTDALKVGCEISSQQGHHQTTFNILSKLYKSGALDKDSQQHLALLASSSNKNDLVRRILSGTGTHSSLGKALLGRCDLLEGSQASAMEAFDSVAASKDEEAIEHVARSCLMANIEGSVKGDIAKIADLHGATVMKAAVSVLDGNRKIMEESVGELRNEAGEKAVSTFAGVILTAIAKGADAAHDSSLLTEGYYGSAKGVYEGRLLSLEEANEAEDLLNAYASYLKKRGRDSEAKLLENELGAAITTARK